MTIPYLPTALPRPSHWIDFAQFAPYETDATLIAWLRDANGRTRELLGDLTPAQQIGPRGALINPPLWEVAHLAWFAEQWLLRRGARTSNLTDATQPTLARADGLYNSATVPHGARWTLPLHTWREAWGYLDAVTDAICERLTRPATSLEDAHERAYLATLSVFHHDMHNEAFAILRQTLGYAATPSCAATPRLTTPCGAVPADVPADVRIEGDALRFSMGAQPAQGFVFCNEMWSHELTLAPFTIAARPVSVGEYMNFVTATQRALPAFWRKAEAGVAQQHFADWRAPHDDEPMRHVSAFDAQAYCAWARRGLPSEAQWECAAKAGLLAETGHVWEWTASAFAPYTGFASGPYTEYSAPWFDGAYRVLRGGSFLTPRRMLRPTFRNFYTPDRHDMFCGFRTVAL